MKDPGEIAELVAEVLRGEVSPDAFTDVAGLDIGEVELTDREGTKWRLSVEAVEDDD